MNYLPRKNNAAAPLVNYMIDHGVPINTPILMHNVELQRALSYRAYSSAVEEREFLQTELAKQRREGHVSISL